jgi:glycerol-3-phosphate cytidylyltransferase
MKNVYILGGGSFGTAIGNQLASNKNNKAVLFVRSEIQEKEINESHTNKKYFPNKTLNPSLSATSKVSDLSNADLIFISIPSKKIKKVIKNCAPFIKKEALIINLSIGVYKDGETIVDFLTTVLANNSIITMKGPTFSSELINNSHSIFTLGLNSKFQYHIIYSVIKNTNIHIDYTTDIKGVELLSVLKNIYAIIIGIVDAKHNSPNTRFMILTKSFSEIKILLNTLGGREDTLFLACGFGDLGLTALNDLSRNRTLGLLIGKGFYNSGKNKGVVLEGVKTIEFINELLRPSVKERLPLFSKMESFFTNKESNFDIHFDALIDKKMTTILTYGTFDLLHYGHIEILRRARELGDRLVVGLSTDDFNNTKGKKCEISYEKRKEFLETIGYVDLVIPESSWDQKKEDIIDNEIDMFIMGDDWEGEFDFLEEYCKVLYLPRTIGISTTKLKSIINKN